MKYVTLKVALTCVTLASICASGATFAQGGRNGGSGGGNTRGAATSGAAYHGDPVSTRMSAMSPDEATNPAKSGQ